MRIKSRNLFIALFVAYLFLITINYGVNHTGSFYAAQNTNVNTSDLVFPVNPSNLSTNYKTLPLNQQHDNVQSNAILSEFFLENQGQFSNSIAYYAYLPWGIIGFGKSQVFFITEGQTSKLTFTGAKTVTPQGEDFLESYSNFFYEAQAYTHIRHCRTVIYEELYKGITLVYKFSPKGLKYDFIVDPYAPLEQIQMTYTGFDDLTIEPTKLAVGIADVILYDDGLQAWYEATGQSIPIKFGKCDPIKGYNSESRSNEDAQQLETRPITSIQFVPELPYDRTQRIIIDPVIWTYSTYLGGNADDSGNDIAVDSSGNILVSGSTLSNNFPIANAYQSTSAGSNDIFVTKFSADGQTLIFSTFFGGSDEDFLFSMEVDSSGNIVITGTTSSTDFPTTENVYQNGSGGGWDQFITKFSADGQTLIFSTFFGGSDEERGTSVAFDANDNIVVTGITSSIDLPVLNAVQPNLGGNFDAFIAKFSSDGETLIFSTYLGSFDRDYGDCIVVDASGDLVVSGYTYSQLFPTTANAYQEYKREQSDGFIAKFSADGQTLIFATFIGGSGTDAVEAVVTDASGNITIIGSTTSSNLFVKNAAQFVLWGGTDAFIARFSSNGQSSVYLTYLGGSHDEFGADLTFDNNGNIIAIGTTASDNFPNVNATQINRKARKDAFVTKFNQIGNEILFSTYIGGDGDDWGNNIAVDSANNILAIGVTNSTNFQTINAFQDSYGGADDVFICKFSSSATTSGPTSSGTIVNSSSSFELVFVSLGLVVATVITFRKKINKKRFLILI
ncbi:MAG: SBBP repeat-containing protein [Promethearchaeota archaeon]